MVFSVGVHRASKNQPAGDSVVIYLDKEQVSDLISRLRELRDDATVDHFDFFSSEWGNGSLTLIPQENGAETVHRLKIAIVE